MEEIVHILLKPDRVCTKVPCSIANNVTFVVDTSKLGDKKDGAADDMGVWKNNWVDRYVQVSMKKIGSHKSRNAALLLLVLLLYILSSECIVHMELTFP